MAAIKLPATVRNEFGKGASRRIRANDEIPAVLYGHETDPIHLTLPGHQTMLAVRHTNALLDVQYEGKTQLALVKSVQRHPYRNRRFIQHIDLLVVRRGEKVEVDVALHVVGEPVSPAIATLDTLDITVNAPATDIPDYIEVNVEGMEDGTNLTVGDLKIPGDLELLTDPELPAISIAEPRANAEDVAEDEAIEAAGEDSADGETAGEQSGTATTESE